MNKLYYGDNLDVMRKFIRPVCVETVDLCYIDPPFNSRALRTARYTLKQITFPDGDNPFATWGIAEVPS